MKKWRNKITGEINEFMVHKRIEDSEDGNLVYAPFDGRVDEWEDYEEPKGVRSIYFIGTAVYIEMSNQKEAIEVEEKLKAWERLKDKGFINEQVFSMNLNWCNPDDDDWKDFHLLFGGRR